MDQDIRHNKQEEVQNILPSGSGHSEYDGHGNNEKSGSKLSPKEDDLIVGVTLDEELIKIRGNNSFILVVSSIMVSFAFAEMIVFGVPFLELIPPLECNIDGTWMPCIKEQA
jgi:hypothetical protein